MRTVRLAASPRRARRRPQSLSAEPSAERPGTLAGGSRLNELLKPLPGEAPEARIAVGTAVRPQTEQRQRHLVPPPQGREGARAKAIVTMKHGSFRRDLNQPYRSSVGGWDPSVNRHGEPGA